MTDINTAVQMELLEDFEGVPVASAALIVPGLAGGLRDAMTIENHTWRKGDKVFLLVEVTVGPVRHENDKRFKDVPLAKRPWQRVHVGLEPVVAVVDEEFARDHIDLQREKIEEARAARERQAKLDMDDELAERERDAEEDEAAEAAEAAGDGDARSSTAQGGRVIRRIGGDAA